MNRAHQQALVQQTNLGLLNIRQQEINYYLSLHLTFGTQAALIGGFVYNVFTQQPLHNGSDVRLMINNICWMISAATIAVSIHVVINTVLLQVLGPGLALHGPVGSIIRSTEGMKIEQKQIVGAFILMVMLFALSTTLSFWVVMSLRAAIGSTAVFVIAARQWYYYTERIYLRFYWDAEKNPWQYDSQHSDEENEEDNSPRIYEKYGDKKQDKSSLQKYTPPRISTIQSANQDIGNNKERSTSISSTHSHSTKSSFRIAKFFSKFRQSKKAAAKNKENATEGGGNAGRTTLTDNSIINPRNSGDKQLAMEGYLAKSGFTSTNPRREPFQRRYFTLSKTGLIFYFKSRLDYKAMPKSPINMRPLNLLEYNVLVENTDREERLQSVERCESVDGGPAMTHRSSYNLFSTGSVADSVFGGSQLGRKQFEMTLILKEEEQGASCKRWIFACDTEEELEVWLGVMKLVSPDSFTEFQS